MDQPFPRPDAPTITRVPALREPVPLERRPDPGSRRGAVIGGLLAAALIVLVAVIQQSGWSAVKAANAPPPSASDIQPPPVLFEIMGRLYVKLNAIVAGAPKGSAPGPNLAQAASEGLGPMAETPEQQVRLAIVEAEMGEPDQAVGRLRLVGAALPEDSPLAGDVTDLILLYQPPVEGRASAEPGPAATARLEDHHGWFGKLAATYGKPATDPARREAAGGGELLGAFLALFGLAVLLAILAGSVLLIIGIVKAASGRLRTRFVPPAPGGSVAIETVAVFAGGFILMKIVTELISERLADPATALVVVLSMQWVLALVIFWPVVRGVKAKDGLALFGIYRGRGVLREIGCGIVGYLACLPLFVLGALISIVLLTIQEFAQEKLGYKAERPGNDILDLVGRRGHSGVIVLLFLLASAWAPLVEEAIFRGALYRQLRARWHWFGAAAVTALAFGAMHGYPVPLLFPIMGLGFGFALLREWRGSTIACMTAHSIHNAAALTLMLVTVRLLGM